MKKIFLLPLFGLLAIAITITIACQKGVEKPPEAKKTTTIVSSPKWGANDDRYVVRIKEFTRKFHTGALNRMSTYCISGTGDSTYGWFSDTEGVIPEGPYVVAKVGSYESDAENCPSVDTLVADAITYLTNEGYSDIVELWNTEFKKHKIIHAANVLVDLKEQYLATYARSSTVWHCLLEAIGGAALADLATNWAIMSRTAMIKAVGKLAAKHLNWIGAIMAVVTFVDCMWG